MSRRRELEADEPLLITREQAADLCQVSPSKIDEWTHRVGFPVIREGQTVRIPRDAMKRWLEKTAAKTNAREESIDVSKLPLSPRREFRPRPG